MLEIDLPTSACFGGSGSGVRSSGMGGGEEPLEGDSGREGRCPAEVVEAGRSGERGTRALA